jgi:hypothetical protein
VRSENSTTEGESKIVGGEEEGERSPVVSHVSRDSGLKARTITTLRAALARLGRKRMTEVR